MYFAAGCDVESGRYASALPHSRHPANPILFCISCQWGFPAQPGNPIVARMSRICETACSSNADAARIKDERRSHMRLPLAGVGGAGDALNMEDLLEMAPSSTPRPQRSVPNVPSHHVLLFQLLHRQPPNALVNQTRRVLWPTTLLLASGVVWRETYQCLFSQPDDQTSIFTGYEDFSIIEHIAHATLWHPAIGFVLQSARSISMLRMRLYASQLGCSPEWPILRY
jgi:hypothetical protein